MQDPSLSDLFCVRGKSVLITGGGGGIGRMLTETFLRAGAKVTITGRKPEALDRVREEFAPLGELRTITGDLSTGTGAQAVAEAYLATGAPLNVEINNAGRAWGAPPRKAFALWRKAASNPRSSAGFPREHGHKP